MRRILLLTLEYPPDRGGVARYYGGLVGAMPAGSVVVMRARLSRWIWPRWLPLLWQVWRTVRREKITEIWGGHLLPLGTVVYLLKKLLTTNYKLQTTVFVHGYDLLLAETHPRKRMIARRILNSADRIVTNSEYGKSLVVARGISEAKVTVVYPCPTAVFSPFARGSERGLRERYHLEDKKILLTVARLVERKGIDLVLEALKKIDNPNIVYVIIGDGPEKEKLNLQLTTYNLSALLVGAVSDKALSMWYALCDVFIMTPRKIGPDVEGFGLVYLEANAFGKPVIGSRTGGVPEAVVDGETGLLVNEGDVDGIAKAIERLFSDDALRKKLGEQGRTRVEQEFQWETQAQILFERSRELPFGEG
ncbi:MAG: glycosyltransferase family 4 protein [bacterium]|nr:glycosyltransferase family 4 protein [bacterium]MDO8581587.1 glycosyltransferase family 4 protein [bacterium]